VIEKLGRIYAVPVSNRVNLILSWAIIALAALLRLINLGYPKKLVFDETYYVKDAYTLWREGAEQSWPNNPNPAFEAGQVNTYLDSASFVVHPPLGKWIIGLGMWLFGAENSFSWRIAVAVLGIASVALVILVARLIFNSWFWANLAGLFLAIEGQAIVMSRTGLLDGSLAFFALLAFYFVIRDQNSRSIERLSFARPWLWTAGVALGAAMAVKWSGLYFLAAFGLYVVLYEALDRRAAQQQNWLRLGAVQQGWRNFVILVPTAALTYLASWSGWLISSVGYSRQWADSAENRWTGLFSWVPTSLQSLWHYHVEALNFHVNLRTPHSYQANPLTWLFNVRPTSFFYESGQPYDPNCPAFSETACSSAITALAHPVIWLTATAAVFVTLYLLLRNRDRVAGMILLGLAGGYLPWLALTHRTVFQFYSVVFTPWMILALVFVIQKYLASAAPRQRLSYQLGITAFVLLCIALAAYFLPVWIGTWIPYSSWQLRMWLPSWI
jgi:dolichyl-phosphate-mannose--protein O-mannosyl transferase